MYTVKIYIFEENACKRIKYNCSRWLVDIACESETVIW